MKNNKTPWLLMLLVSGICILVPPQITKNNTDHWAEQVDAHNPFIPVHNVYARIPEKPVASIRDSSHGIDYVYNADTFDTHGRLRKIRLISFGNERLAPMGHYLKIKIKGQSVHSFEAVTFDQIPKNSLQNLRINY